MGAHWAWRQAQQGGWAAPSLSPSSLLQDQASETKHSSFIFSSRASLNLSMGGVVELLC